MTRIEGLLQNSSWLLSEDDPERADHGGPKFFPAVDGPLLQVRERSEATGRHQLPDVRRSRAGFGRHPGWPGTISRFTTIVREPVQSEMGREPPPRLRVRQEQRAELEPEPSLSARIERSGVTLRCRVDSSREFFCGLPRHAPRFNVGGPDGGPHGGRNLADSLKPADPSLIVSVRETHHFWNPGPAFSVAMALRAYSRARSTASRGVATGTNSFASTPALSMGHVRRPNTVLPRSKAWAISLNVP